MSILIKVSSKKSKWDIIGLVIKRIFSLFMIGFVRINCLIKSKKIEKIWKY
jgi:hypothetical protein